MNRVFKIFSVLSITILFASCKKDDGPEVIPPRPHAEVYAEDLAKIEDYLKAHYILVDKVNGDVTNVEIDSTDTAHPVSIWNQTEYPLLSKIVKLHGVDFKVYYLKLDTKTDTDADGDKPCGADRVFCTYRGTLLDGTQFDIAQSPVEFNLVSTIRGWEYIFPEFRAGYFDPVGSDGTLNPRNYGSGVMFVPSGLAYFNNGNINIPGYAPLVFTFNLFGVTHLDQDGDKILSKYEYVFNDDGTLLDSDGDGRLNLYDADDDNDGYNTIDEIKFTYMDGAIERTGYYPYHGAAVDDPATSYDERRGIPRCFTGPNSTVSPFLPTSVQDDFTEPSRLRRHLDPNCKPPFGG